MISRSNGNVLFLILIAVVLFAALSYAVTQSSRGGGNADSEVNTLTASRMFQYSTAIQHGLHKMQILNGCGDTDISFARDGDGGGYDHTPVQPDTCRIFHADGGGVTYIESRSFHSSGTFIYLPNGISGVGDEDNSELLMLYTDLDRGTCIAINNLAGITNPSGNPPVDAAGDPWSGVEFTGTYADGITGNGDFLQNTTGNEIQGQSFGCFANAAETLYYYFYVLIER